MGTIGAVSPSSVVAAACSVRGAGSITSIGVSGSLSARAGGGGSGDGRRTAQPRSAAAGAWSASSTCGMIRFTLPQPSVMMKSPSRATAAV